MTNVNFNTDEIIAVAASLLSIGSMVYAGYLKGKIKSLEPLLQVSNRYQQLLIVIVLIPSLRNYKSKPVKDRTFQLHSTKTKGFRVAIVHRVKVKRYEFEFDLEKSFQFHFHYGKISVFLMFNPFIIFDNVKDWGGKDVQKQA